MVEHVNYMIKVLNNDQVLKQQKLYKTDWFLNLKIFDTIRTCKSYR